jgi:hypothetical protein
MSRNIDTIHTDLAQQDPECHRDHRDVLEMIGGMRISQELVAGGVYNKPRNFF